MDNKIFGMLVLQFLEGVQIFGVYVDIVCVFKCQVEVLVCGEVDFVVDEMGVDLCDVSEVG